MEEKKKKILVVDDTEINRQFMVRVLEKIDLECYQASNGIEALEIFQKNGINIALIFMDIKMPLMYGDVAVSFIREMEYGNIPIILTTAMKYALPTKKGLFDEILILPLNKDTLIKTVNKFYRRN